MYFITLGTAGLTYLIARATTKSDETSLLSVVLLMSMVMFVQKTVEIRTDVPQVFTGLISVYCLVRFLKTNSTKCVIFSALAASVSFLIVQKTLFLLLAYAAIFTYGLLRGRISTKHLLYCGISVSVPILVFVGYLLESRSFEDYILTNWLLHMHQLESFSPFAYLNRSLTAENCLFWLLLPVSLGIILLGKKAPGALKTTTFIGVVLLSSVFTVTRPFRQYFMFAIPLLSIALAYFVQDVFERFRLGYAPRVVLITLLVIQPLNSLLPLSTNHEERDRQLEQVDFVVHNSEEGDIIYDGNIKFNLYRRDLHYFWFSVAEGTGLDTYNSLTNNKYGDYDACELIRSKLPRLISDYQLDIAACGLGELYESTPFDNLYMRAIEHRLWRNVGDIFLFRGYSLPQEEAQAGDALDINLCWETSSQPTADYTAFIHLVGPDGRIWAQQDTLVEHAGLLTSAWDVGQLVIGRYDLQVPTNVPSGEYGIKAGIYYWETGERLPVWDEEGNRLRDDAVLLEPSVVIQ